jgi:hypothetical protein
VATWVGALVDVVHQPGEGAGVERLAHGVPVLPRLLQLQRDLRDVPANVDLPDHRNLAGMESTEEKEKDMEMIYSI